MSTSKNGPAKNDVADSAGSANALNQEQKNDQNLKEDQLKDITGGCSGYGCYDDDDDGDPKSH